MDLPPPSRGRALRGRARQLPRGRGSGHGAVPDIEIPMADVHLGDEGGRRAGPSPPEEEPVFLPGDGTPQPPPRAQSREAVEAKEVWEEFMMRRDYLKTKPLHLESKKGTLGISLPFVANYFPVELRENLNWRLQQYRVDFNPDQDSTFIRKLLIRKLKDQLPAYIYDGGGILYSHGLMQTNPLILNSIFVQNDKTEQVYEIIIKKTKDLAWNDPAVFQFFNIVVRKSLAMSQLDLMGRFYYDHNLKKDIPAYQLEIWPGYKTVMRPHEDRILLNVEMVSKVIRTDTVLKMMYKIRDSEHRESMRAKVEAEVCSHVVMTTYNRKTYSIAAVLWDKKVIHTFETKNGAENYINYYKTRYGLTIKDENQPLLMARPNKRDVHGGLVKDIILVPELCQLTGLTETMRSDYKLMHELKGHLLLEPAQRVHQIQAFMRSMIQNVELRTELRKWGVRYPTDSLVDVPGRKLEGEKIMFANQNEFIDPQNTSDWTKAFRTKKLLATIPMKKWAIIIPQRDAMCLDNLIRTLKNVSTPLGFIIGEPLRKLIGGINPRMYEKAIDEIMAESKGHVDMVFIVLPNNQLPLYATVKQKCAVHYGILSQCMVSRNAQKANMSVCTKIAVQMCAKLGGEPWSINNPLCQANCMIVGYDVYHSGGPPHKKTSVGAMVASLNPAISKYTSSVTMSQKTELSASMGTELLKLLLKYKDVNLKLPSRILFYRDGVGEGQLQQVEDTEISSIESCLQSLYEDEGLEVPKFSFIVVSKRISTRLMLKTDVKGQAQYQNPPSGSVVDDVVTLPERYDFFLVSQSCTQGTVSPTSYNVLRDHPSLKPSQMQLFTFKLCHLYYNWSGTVAVPAVCQYAHKLAYLTGLALNAPANSNLSNLLHFL